MGKSALKQIGYFVVGSLLGVIFASYIDVYIWQNFDIKFSESLLTAFQLALFAGVVQALIGSLFFAIGTILILYFLKENFVRKRYWLLVIIVLSSLYSFTTYLISRTSMIWIFLVFVPLLLALLLHIFIRYSIKRKEPYD